MPIFESGVMRSRVLLFEFFLVQVMNSYCLFAKPTSHRALLVLPGPRRSCSIVSDCSHMLLCLVLLAGDVESNPGPDKEILKVLNELQSGQTVMLAQLKSIEKKLADHDKTFSEIKARLDKIETSCASIDDMQAELVKVNETCTENTAQINALSTRMNEAENRSRRNNLVFYGIEDKPKETWLDSEKIVIEHCKQILDIQVEPRDIERAHRIGSYQTGKRRPIIVKFAHFKYKEHILSSGRKFKDTGYAVAQDLSPSTRLAHKRLSEFGRAQNMRYRLRHEKLITNDKTYYYDHITNRVVEERQ